MDTPVPCTKSRVLAALQRFDAAATLDEIADAMSPLGVKDRRYLPTTLSRLAADGVVIMRRVGGRSACYWLS